MDSTNFKAEKIARSATITLNADIKTVFPLFGAFEERKWAGGWNPTPIYPIPEAIEEGTTFSTPGHGHGENKYLWRVSKYEDEQHLIQYMVYTENRCWTITVACRPLTEHTTEAAVTYSFIGLNAFGNEINKHALNSMFKDDLKDWATEINSFLATRK